MVAIVNEAFARKYFPGKDAVGETVLIDLPTTRAERAASSGSPVTRGLIR